VGIALVVLGSGDGVGIGAHALLALPLLVALSYAVEGTLIRACNPGFDTLTTVLGTTWAAFVLLLPISMMHDISSVAQNPGLAEAAILGGAVLHLGGYCGFVWLIGRAGPVFASQVGYLVTATGIITGLLIFGERFGSIIWLAAALMIGGLLLVRPSR
jgi:drug/metabolite transporter (DMT)-like permease